MNSLIGRFRLLAAAVCGATLFLAGCNAVEDVREEPSTPIPLAREVVGGTITGLGYRRPLVLEDVGAKRCTDPLNNTGPLIYCTLNFFGNFDQPSSQFTFGSLEIGTPYDIQIRTQPYGKECRFTNPAQARGTVVANAAIDIQMVCETNTDIARYCIGGTLPSPVRDIPGLRITLSTEEGLKVLSNDAAASPDGPLPPAGQACWFPDSIFNSGSSLPIMRWYVTANYPGTGGKVNNCRVTGGAANSGSNDLGENTAAPQADVTNVAVPQCDFTIGGTVGYTQQAGVAYTAQTINGLGLKLKAIAGDWAKDSTGAEVAEYVVPAYSPATTNNGATTNTFTIGGGATRFLSNPDALYDVQITAQPAGKFCMIGATGTTVPISAGGRAYPAGAQITIGAGAQLADTVRPLTNTVINSDVYAWTTYVNIGNLAVRCRALPGTAGNASGVLAGTYQLTTNVTTTVTTSSGTTTANTTSLTRNFMTFFEDGSYIYATRVGATGVERGFYYYNTAAGTISFTVLTDTNNNFPTNTLASNGTLTAAQLGISALPSLTLTSVAKIPGTRSQITAFAGTTTTSTTTTSTSWQLDEPSAVAGEMEGTWATPDHRRFFVYDASTTFGAHASTIGTAVNFGDGCYFLYQLNNVPNYHTAEGYYARRGTSANGTGNTSGGSESSTGCPVNTTTPATSGVSLDYYTPVPLQRLQLNYPWRLPGSNSGFDGRSPSPIFFDIVAGSGGTPDQVTITASNQGVLQPATEVTFVRTKGN